jgi:hypothetical protein
VQREGGPWDAVAMGARGEGFNFQPQPSGGEHYNVNYESMTVVSLYNLPGSKECSRRSIRYCTE